tara:strand:+ start:1345 stop:2430 length:1086 start_codon:yes stop_codon:yes gene_type:complete
MVVGMYLLLNREEAVIGLAKNILSRHLKKIQPQWTFTSEYLNKCKKRQIKTGFVTIDLSYVNQLLMQDIHCHKDNIATEYKKKYRPLIAWLVENLDQTDIDYQQLVDIYLNNDTKSFVKTIGLQLTDDPVWKIDGDIINDDRPVVVRNIINHESLLQHKLKKSLPFWFIDTGYTNFITGQKQWHRLVANHIHHAPQFGYFPPDRLCLLPSMPQPWRSDGNAILVIENSDWHYRMFGTTQQRWRKNIENQLAKYTDREIVFRPKDLNRKTRDNLYEHLKSSDYYCVINDASAASIEAVWAGVPIITLNRHISIPVARTSISDINNLYRGPIGNWLCALSYSQFTEEEMYDGTALRLIKKYHV